MKSKTTLHRMFVLLITLMSAIGANAQEAYACYTPSNTTLTFYYDGQRDSREGTTYDLNTGSAFPGWVRDDTNTNVTQVIFHSSFANVQPTSTYAWFRGMENLQSFNDMNYLNTSEVTNMEDMFFNCACLTSLDLSSFNTYKVTNMDAMFMWNRQLKTIYVGSGWNTDAVTKSDNMFFECKILVGGKGTTYIYTNPKDKTYAHIDGGSSNPGYFSEKPNEAYACYTSGNTTLTFYYDNQRNSRPGTTYDLNTGATDTGWDTDGTKSYVTKVVFDPSFAGARPTTTYDWFYYMANLQSIEGMNYLNTSEVTNMAWMFSYCENLTSLDLSSFNTSKVTRMLSMFYKCSSLTSLDLSSFNTSKVISIESMFRDCSSLQTIYVGDGWNMEAVSYDNEMFTGCTSLVGGQGTAYDANHILCNYARIDGGASNPGYFTEKPKEAYACYTSTNKTLTFYYDNLRSSRTGTTYDLNTGKNATGWDTDGTKSSVTKVVFDPSFAEVRPTTTYRWFYQMTNLESIEGICYLNTSEVTNMFGMFAVCKKLTVLDLSSFNTAQVTDMGAMFWKCSELQTIYVGEGWSIAAVTGSSRMFEDCTKLKGGQGTKYSSSHVEKPYAHIDGGPSYPGYFTARNIGITTRIENGQRESVKGQSEEWFTIDGQKLSGKPTKKGVYIYNGRAVVL